MQGTNDVIYWFLDKRGEIIFSNVDFDPNTIPEILIGNKKGVISALGKKARFANCTTAQGIIIILTFNEFLVLSSRIFDEKVKIYTDFISTIVDIKAKIIEDTLHDITKVHAHNIQEVHNVIPEELMYRSFEKQIADIKKQIIGNLDDTAIALIQIIRNNRIMKAEFENIRLIHGGEVATKFRPIKIDKIIQSILYLYDQDFQNKKIKTNNDETAEQVSLDYDFFVGALIPIFENIIKYSKDNSRLRIEYFKEGDKFIVRFKMRSLIFSHEEELLILSKNYSGDLAHKTGKSGTGLGMYHAQKLLLMNKARVKLYFLDDAEIEGNFRDNILDIIFEKR